MGVFLATVKSNCTGTTFELKFVCYFVFFICHNTETNKDIPFETLNSVLSLSAKFKKKSFRRRLMCLIGVHLHGCNIIQRYYFSLNQWTNNNGNWH